MAYQRYDQGMPNVPPRPPPPSQPSWTSAAPAARFGHQRWVAYTALAIAVVALGLAIGAWFRPVPMKPPAAPPYSAQQVADAKVTVCSAYDQVRKAGDTAGQRNAGSDPTSILTVATSTRQVLDSGSRYLTTKLSAEPATPPDLAAAVRKLAEVYQEMTVDYLDGLSNSDPQLAPLLKAGDQAHSTIQDLCR